MLVKAAQQRGINLRQSYRKVGKKALIMQGRYSRASQMRRAAKQTKKLKVYLGRVTRDIERKASKPDEALVKLLQQANQLLEQQRHDKHKIYSVHAQEVECISKGKAHKRYEFGNKASFVVTSKNSWLVGAQSLEGNPYDGHTLEDALGQAERITKISKKKIKNVYTDQGYRGHGIKDKNIIVCGRIPKSATRSRRYWMLRGAAIEPSIGHLKSDHRLSRNYLKGVAGNQANVILAACGYNLAKLLAWFCCAWRNYVVLVTKQFKFISIRVNCFDLGLSRG